MTIEAETHQMLGGVKATVEHLTTTVQNMVTMWASQENSASEGRRVLHEKVESLKTMVIALDNRVASVEKTLAEIRPAVKEFENQREQQMGAMKLGKWMWGVMLGAAGGIGWGLNQWLSIPKLPIPPH